MNLTKTIHSLSKIEKIATVFLSLIAAFSGLQVASAFYHENTTVTPVKGGVYVEGAVGTVTGAINPLLVHQGTVASDLTGLIFSGLTKYDAETGEVIADLANFKLSADGKEYTFVIKENAKWQDGEPVTADDVLFTFNDVIKNPEFTGAILTYSDYSGIKVVKIDDRTVQFLLEKPDSFFLVKTTVGLLPKHLLENEPVAFMESSPFNFNPIGSGRYRFISPVTFPDRTEYSLESFQDFYDGPPNIETILLKVFPEWDDLAKNLGSLDGIRNVPAEDLEKVESKYFKVEKYQLPQYVAVFLNTESAKLKDGKVRLALQLGTDKEGLIKAIGQDKIVDTPLLEIDQANWVNQYSVVKANGALFDTEWKIPKTEEVMSETTADESAVTPEEVPVSSTAEVTYINSPNEGKDWKTTNDTVTITGTVPKDTKAIFVDDYQLQKYVPGDSGWSYVAAVKYDNLKPGDNIIRIYAVDFKDEKKEIDAITITYGSPEKLTSVEKDQLKEENEAAPAELPIRENGSGEKLSLNLITSANPLIYQQVAQIMQEQWKRIGVQVNIEVLENDAFQQRINNRDYDLLIFGQNLGYNLDAYPYWHSSQAKVGGLNLSQFKNFVADSLLEKARYEYDAEDRKNTLSALQNIISIQAPAVFLYSPNYYFAVKDSVQNTSFAHLATTSDRFSTIGKWYAKVDRKFVEGSSPITFLIWLGKQF